MEQNTTNWAILQQMILDRKDRIDCLKQDIVRLELEIEDLEKKLIKVYDYGNENKTKSLK